ncbi:MAG: acetyl-CoA C-acyltransferase [Dehalococcoidia bacterium]|jgi:acetyl-CoA C-acetyltransferase|nr:acetyl-CoA C-acyltransferase [Chloroflexota bacterium]MDP6508511.1 acetyl-CoA C-acyltransferase [Chloroflexota bacterium]MDP6823485.1 acetyl-CoA C-acyltransferase [Dehalococcoidia bacterium]
MTPDPVIILAKRTAIGRLLGALSDLSAVDLGAQLARRTLAAAGVDPAAIQQTILGCVLQAGQGMNVARQVAIAVGIPESRPAFTINQVCGSGLKSVELAAQQIRLGEADLVLAGGVESMSRAPFLLQGWRGRGQHSETTLLDSLYRDGLLDSFEGIHMGITAERLAADFDISREAQDAYAAESQSRYREAQESLAEEILPIDTAVGAFSVDEHPRQTSPEKLANLAPTFQPDGSVTVGNSSGLNDGAAIVLVADRDWADANSLAYNFALRGFVNVGLDPGRMGLGPVDAIRGLRERFDITDADIDLCEINEAFAAQTLAVLKALDLDAAKVNVNGGAIALGHPLGASGARILVTLLHELKRRDARRGIASLCIGGGMGIAALVEAP